MNWTLDDVYDLDCDTYEVLVEELRKAQEHKP